MDNRSSQPAAAGIDWTAGGFAKATRNFQAFAEEIAQISSASFAQSAKLIDELKSARDIGDIVAIQTKFMTGMFETFNEQVRAMMFRMSDFSTGMGKSVEDLTQAGVEAAHEAIDTTEAAFNSAMSTFSDVQETPAQPAPHKE
jgi:energy-coupling factor transporter transmembrane protein EcfT